MAERQAPLHPAARATLAVAVAIVSACGPAADTSPSAAPPASPTASASPIATGAHATAPPAADRLVLMTHDSFAISDDVLAEFTTAHGTVVDVLRSGDAGSMVNQAILARDAPLADVIYGVDNSFLSRALEADLFVAHEPAAAAELRRELILDDQWRVTPIDYGDVCLNYDRQAFGADVPPPATLADLARPEYGGMLVVENPATSSPGLAFLLATVVAFGEEGSYTWLDYWAELRANDVLVTSGWTEAYYTAFSGGSGEGDRPIVVSYAASPVAEVVFADPVPAEPPTGVVEDGCFRQIEFAGVLRRPTGVAPAAAAFLDFMASRRFQEDIPLNMFVLPANGQAALPEAFVEHATTIGAPLTLDPAAIDAGRERWIEEWTDAVLR